MRSLSFAVVLGLSGIAVAFAQGVQPKVDAPFASSAEIDAASIQAATSTNSVSRLLPDGTYQYFVATRKQPGLAEIHTQWTDVTTIRSGRGVLRSGHALAGQREASPGEWRGDAVLDATERPVAAGDLVVIPVGIAHQLRPIGADAL